jgi:hypothetical protein
MATGPSPYVATAPRVDQQASESSAVLDAGGVEDPPQTAHRVSIVEKGSFARAVCDTCDWQGPARRARGFAAGDIEEHRLLAGRPVTVDLRDPA